MHTVKTSSKGQVVIPIEIREKLEIKPGQMVKLSLEGERAVTTPLPPLLSALKKIVPLN
ncbi:MAG: AbrB/MazE/SpoVT family DNA-binding domain-containing protein [Deltaproteobacteria bacterium]|jgi:AbrB family looped-hinge helix DNA binding protein|nr:AbrB/MazE/SpoVT family DNA-binding domain-containing protein [Deltaproteobacteria bacterium]